MPASTRASSTSRARKARARPMSPTGSRRRAHPEERESAAGLLEAMADRIDPLGTPDHSWVVVNLADVAKEPPEPPTIVDLFYPGKQHLVSGEPEALKSWLGLIACLEEIKAGRHAAYVDLEMGRRDMLNRVQDLGLDDALLDRLMYFDPSEPITSATVRPYIDELFTERRPSVVVIDSYEGALFLHGVKPNESDGIEAFQWAVVKPILAHGAAVILIDHVAKDKESRLHSRHHRRHRHPLPPMPRHRRRTEEFAITSEPSEPAASTLGLDPRLSQPSSHRRHQQQPSQSTRARQQTRNLSLT